MHLPDWTKNFVGTDEAEKPAPVSHTAPTGTNPPVTVVSSVTPVTDVTATVVSDHSDDAYQKLFAKTDYTTSAVFQKIKKYLDPIASMALDDKTKFNIALQQAKTQEEGISADTLMNVFEQCKAALAQAATDFQGNVQAAMAAQVDSRKQKAEQLSAQITDLRSQVKQLTEDGFAMQQKIQAAQHQFEVALQTRQTELTQDQSKYATLVA